MDETYVWSTVRQHAVEAFAGELPNAHTESSVLAVFEVWPRVVTRAIDEVAADVRSGKVRSGWAILRKRLEGAGTTSDVSVTDSSVREGQIGKAERWIRNTGLHFDREEEIVDALFGQHGPLRDWHDDEVLQRRMVSLWQECRPKGEATEREAEERMAGYREWHAELRAKARAARLSATPNEAA